MSGTSPSTDTKIAALGFSRSSNLAKCVKSKDKSSKLQSHKIGLSPNCMTGAKSVAHETAGTITESPSARSLFSINAANINRLAEDPELTKVECFISK